MEEREAWIAVRNKGERKRVEERITFSPPPSETEWLLFLAASSYRKERAQDKKNWKRGKNRVRRLAPHGPAPFVFLLSSRFSFLSPRPISFLYPPSLFPKRGFFLKKKKGKEVESATKSMN